MDKSTFSVPDERLGTMSPPQTAEQINGPRVGKVTIVPTVKLSATDPDELSKAIESSRAAVPLRADQQFALALKLPRAQLIERVKNAREIPIAWQEIILAEIAVIDPRHELLRLDFLRHGHGVGMNAVLTIKEI